MATLRGINPQGASAGRVVILNTDAMGSDLTLTHEDVAATAAWRFRLPGDHDLTVEAGGHVGLVYTDYYSTLRWELLFVGGSLYEAYGAVAAHEAASDPHPGYLTQTEADGLYADDPHTHPDAATLGHLQAHANDGDAHDHDLNSHDGITELVLHKDDAFGPTLRLRNTTAGRAAINFEDRPDPFGIDQWGPTAAIEKVAGGLSLHHNGGLGPTVGWLIDGSGNLVPIYVEMPGDVGKSDQPIGTLYAGTVNAGTIVATNYGLEDSDIPSSIVRLGLLEAHRRDGDAHRHSLGDHTGSWAIGRHIVPAQNGYSDLGSSAKRVRDAYVGTIYLGTAYVTTVYAYDLVETNLVKSPAVNSPATNLFLWGLCS